MQRRDSRGRILFRGERQRSDGRYEFRYKDELGAIRSVYSWRLVKTDKTPDGKTDMPPLRDQEKKIRRDLEDSVSSFTAQRTTLNEFFELYMSIKTELKDSTRGNYLYMYDNLRFDCSCSCLDPSYQRDPKHKADQRRIVSSSEYTCFPRLDRSRYRCRNKVKLACSY